MTDRNCSATIIVKLTNEYGLHTHTHKNLNGRSSSKKENAVTIEFLRWLVFHLLVYDMAFGGRLDHLLRNAAQTHTYTILYSFKIIQMQTWLWELYRIYLANIRTLNIG